MTDTARLHHYAQNITPGTLEAVIEMYRLLGAEVVYRPNTANNWAMVGQPNLNFSIQIIEVKTAAIADIAVKRNVHLAFLSDAPQCVVGQIEAWAATKKIEFRKGGRSDKELYFDLPEIFVDFVIEVMDSSIAE